MSSIGGVLKQAVSAAIENPKVADLQRSTVEATAHHPNGYTHTTDHGVPVSDTDNWLKVSGNGGTGPSLLEDQFAREKTHRFDHERIPERVVHARGAGAHGHFKVGWMSHARSKRLQFMLSGL